jgi:hypothetical protein
MSIEASVRAKLLNQSAVTSIVGSGGNARIRPYKLWQKDDIRTGPAIIIKVNREEDQNDLECEGGIVISDVSVICIAEERADARALAQAVKFNGTAPGTGLAHSAWNELTVPLDVQSCCFIYAEYDFTPYSDDSDEGFYWADCHYTVIYTEAI